MWTVNNAGCLIGPDGEYGFAVAQDSSSVQVLLSHDDSKEHSEAIVLTNGDVETIDGFFLGTLTPSSDWSRIAASPD